MPKQQTIQSRINTGGKGVIEHIPREEPRTPDQQQAPETRVPWRDTGLWEAEEYPLIRTIALNLAGGTISRMTIANPGSIQVLVTVTTGTLDVFFGDGTNPASDQYHARFQALAVVNPQTFWLPGGMIPLAFLAGAGAALTATISFFGFKSRGEERTNGA